MVQFNDAAREPTFRCRGVAPVAALGYRSGAAERGSDTERFITTNLLCQGTPVGSQASQPAVNPSGGSVGFRILTWSPPDRVNRWMSQSPAVATVGFLGLAD